MAGFKGLDQLPPLSPLQPISEEEAIQILADPPLPPFTFTLRDYVDHSETLRKLVFLGVDLSKIEKHPDAANLLLRLDFEKDIKQILLFLKDLGIEDNQLGTFLTKNYAIFSEDLENLKTRVAYLQSKKFSKTDIAQMVRNAPFLLNFSVERLDNRLGFFQKELELNVEKVYRLELGFKRNEIQHMITKIPKMLTANKRKLTETFDYVHNVMNIPHYVIVRFPQQRGRRHERGLTRAASTAPARASFLALVLDLRRLRTGPSPPSRTYPVGNASVPAKMASRPAATNSVTISVAASGRWLEGIRKWYYNAAGFNKLGLMRDDTIHVDDDVKEAIRRLPENVYNDRVFRIKRALDLTMRQQILPKEQWTKYEEDKFYLEPYLKEVIRERKEREEWAKK
ncbi:mTERF domain-containing protein 1, mitochondrial [Pteropus alecto]|uniref:Cytochrome b-c1 complex subunit 7 n=1 Tax=Pteropus alecto TaxID=9402 RepID=L5KAD0_PTEAL|nr:mTERF domain-containing protein 1, mitochondrial [Pteropus alecto]